MELPPSFKQQGTEGKVLPLRRSLYSLKQSARVWNLVATKVVGEIVRPTHVFSLEKKGIMQLSSVSPELTYRVRQQLSGYFKIKGLGNVEREEGGSFLLHQAGKICHLIKEHGLLDAKSIATPMETNFLSSTAEESVVLFENVQYRRAVGFLLLFSNGITARHCIRCWSIMSACRVTDSV
ncbi:hypothetical protein M513_09017 [Trichuris suis]|uniref:Reverse transcriptase Ty1/copia-type domain-containing protein n=1 Tax=Trichuris suis TaxID=68888 RepID=A0A085LYL1_9BILA|nr:hypothetical protein M513_09017 [Trichuris suis]